MSLPEGKPPFSYDFPMVFLRFSYGFPVQTLFHGPSPASKQERIAELEAVIERSVSLAEQAPVKQ